MTFVDEQNALVGIIIYFIAKLSVLNGNATVQGTQTRAFL
jgi:hypothetical protein